MAIVSPVKYCMQSLHIGLPMYVIELVSSTSRLHKKQTVLLRHKVSVGVSPCLSAVITTSVPVVHPSLSNIGLGKVTRPFALRALVIRIDNPPYILSFIGILSRICEYYKPFFGKNVDCYAKKWYF